MPVWHKATQQWVKDGKLVVLGITQEQHADRCRLFSQWQKFDWPILWDPINSLESAAVPIVVAIDEQGVVRSTRPKPETFESEFLNVTFENTTKGVASESSQISAVNATRPDLTSLQRTAENAPTDSNFRDWADACVLWGGASKIDTAINAYRQASELNADDAKTLFRLGVAYRLRHDSDHRHAHDFQIAVDHWQKALTKNPNQYIWRRRIQQYGPRLEKPYSFYDWIAQARQEIIERGEFPVSLIVDPYGAELATPTRTFAVDSVSNEPPDPKGQIARDAKSLIESEVTLVPPRVQSGGSTRVHIELRPNSMLKAHWNNEANPLLIWIDAPEGWKISQQFHSICGPENQSTSIETRHIDIEVQLPLDAHDVVTLPAYAVYFVCEDENGTCLYLRKDIRIDVEVHATD